jgi:tRNA A-37 threonylcarbamoyl transferase component Bud32
MKQGMASQSPTRSGGAGAGAFEPPDPAELAERFPQLEILELIGHGGMGAVYKARQPRLDRLVALKILAPHRVQDPAFAERFTREARTLARLSHPHIVGIHDFGEVEGLYFFVMEYVDGASLREVMQAGRLSPGDALGLVPQICGALQFAHDAGVVHRDVKPENILLDRSGGVKIADFGLAKLLEPDRANAVSLTVSGAVMGTPAYMAPEQIEHPLDVDHRADIYAVGVVFYEMLTGELPLGRFDPPSSKVRMDVRLDDVVLRALEKEPTRRYQFASDVSADLKGLAEGRTPAHTPAGQAPRTAAASPEKGPAAARTRTVMITRPPLVSWIAAYSFLGAGFWGLVIAGAPLWLLGRMGGGLLGLGRSAGAAGTAHTLTGPGGLPDAMVPLVLLTGTGLGAVLAVWHFVVGIGALRMRNWARYNLIVLLVLQLPGVLLVSLTWLAVGFLPASIVSVLILVYLFRPSVARLFELGLGPTTLPVAEADAIERVLGRRRWT